MKLYEVRFSSIDLPGVNKFGKQAALGRDLGSTIAFTTERNVQVLVGVNRLNLSEFLTYTAGISGSLVRKSENILGCVLMSLDAD